MVDGSPGAVWLWSLSIAMVMSWKLALIACQLRWHLPATHTQLARYAFFFLLPLMREVKMAVPFYAAQQGTIIRPLGAIFCQSERVPYGQETLPRGLWLFFGMDLLSPHLSKLLQTSLN